MGNRDANTNHPDEDGVWFQILDKNGKRVSLNPDDNKVDCDLDTMLGWFPLSELGSGSSPDNQPIPLVQGLLIDGGTSRLDTKDFECYVSEDDDSPLPGDIIDVNGLGLSKSDPFTIKEKDVPQNILGGRQGMWFQVVDKDGNSIDLSNNNGKFKFPPDKRDPITDVAWFHMSKKHSVRAIRRTVLGKWLDGLKPRNYELYSTDTADTPFDDTDQIDPSVDGTNKYDPLTFKLKTDSSQSDSDNSKSSEKSSSASSSSSSSHKSQESNGGTTQGTTNSDPYQYYTRQVKCTGNADWSRYADLQAIQNSYPGEILWTNGNLVEGIPNMSSYQVVRRSPSTPTGAVVNYGLAGNSPEYFVLLG